MAAPKTDEEPEVTEDETPEPEAHEESHDGGVTLSGLADKVDSLAQSVARLARGGSRASKQDESEQVAEQVRTEVGKIKAAEDRQRGREDRLGRLESQVKDIVERAPREYRRITKVMWGDTDD